MKTCSKCQRTYENIEANFGKNKNFKDGYQYICKACKNASAKKPKKDCYCIECNSYIGFGVKKKRCDECIRLRDLDKKAKLYMNDEEFRKKNQERCKKWRIENKVKYKKQSKEQNKKRKKDYVAPVKKVDTYKNIAYWVERLRKVWTR